METLTDRIMRHEGFCQFPKPDAKGMWVVGYGHDLTESQAQDYAHGITADEAGDLLKNDILTCQRELANVLPWALDLSQARQDVLLEMIFQLGINGLMGFHNFLFNSRSGNFAAAAHEMIFNDTAGTIKSEWYKETPARCEELANLYLHDGDEA